MLPPGLDSPRQVTLYYDTVYDKLIESGQATPFVYPWQGIGAFIVLGYLLIDHRQRRFLRWLRYPVFGFLLAFQTWCILYTRARHPAAAFLVGLISAWGGLWTASLLIVNDCQNDFKRLDRHESASTASVMLRKSDISKDSNPRVSTIEKDMRDDLSWQGYPASISRRIEWVADVFCNFRGVGWNWQTSGIPPRPGQADTSKTTAPVQQTTISRYGIRRTNDRELLLRNTLIRLTVGYLILDVIKTIMHNDAYFWGYMNAPAPSHLPPFIRFSPVAVRCYRLAVSLFAVYTALSQAFALGPLFFSAILGPERIGLRGEAWMNPLDMFGSYACVLDYGLAGFWSGWWHQIFRFGFETTADKFLTAMKLDKKSAKGKVIAVLIAFFLSGCLHAAGSYTEIGETRPFMGPMRFFVLQPLGIGIQLLTVQQLSRAGVLQKTPRWLRRLANFVFVHVWGYFTAPLLVDDFAKGGAFIFEPVPFSPLRGLGLGAKDDTWFCWWDGLIWWRQGQSWRDTGFAA